MHKDLTTYTRHWIERTAADLVKVINRDNESLGIGRQVLIEAYDAAAEEVDRAQ